MLLKDINYKQLMFFILITIPIFINLDFSLGLRLDVIPGNKTSLPSINLPLLIIFYFFIFFNLDLLKQKSIFIFLLFSLLLVYINLINGYLRVIINLIGMFIPLVTYMIIIRYSKNKDKVYEHYYLALYIIFFIKLVTDLYFRGSLYSRNFIFDNIMIYSFYDYFIFFYVLLLLLSIYNILNKKFVLISLFAVMLIFYISVSSLFGSRLFIGTILLIPSLLIIFKIIRFKLYIYFIVFFIFSVVFTLLLAFNYPYEGLDGSLSGRIGAWNTYINNINVLTFLIPLTTQNAFVESHSSHNEIVELYRFFGILIFYYYFLVYKMFENIQKKYKIYSLIIMFVIFIGALIQINLTNQYVGVLIGITLAIFSIPKEENEK